MERKDDWKLPDSVVVKRYSFINVKKTPKTARPVMIYDLEGNVAVGCYGKNGKWWDKLADIDPDKRCILSKLVCWCDFPQVKFTKDTY